MRCLPTLLAFFVLSGLLRAHTGGEVEMKCPLDGTSFKAWRDFSGTTFARRLDLKSLGPTASPWSLPQCPKCHLPIYQDEFTAKEKAALQRIVKSTEFLHSVKTGSSYAVLAVIREKTNIEPFKVANSYLQASWQLEDKAAYAEIAIAAIRWFNAAAPKLGDPERDDDYLVSRYAPIELLRRTGQFAAAADQLKTFPSDKLPTDSWLATALARQQVLIAARDIGTDEAYTWEQEHKNRPVPPKLKHALTASTPAEIAFLADAQRIGDACIYLSLENGTDTVKITLDPKSGQVGPAIAGVYSHISPGTELVDDIWESNGTFSLRRPDAFGGREIAFDNAGYATQSR